MAAPILTHFLKVIGFGSMKRGIFSLIFLGFICGCLASLAAWWLRKPGNAKRLLHWLALAIMPPPVSMLMRQLPRRT